MNTPLGSHRRLLSRTFAAACVVVVCGVFSVQASFFTVSEGEAVVVTRLGRPTRTLLEAGPYGKLPSPIDEVHRIDVRSRIFTTPKIAVLTRDKRTSC